MAELTKEQKLAVANQCYEAEDNFPGHSRGWEKRAIVIQNVLELLRPSYKGMKLPLWAWKPVAWFLSRRIADAIEWTLRVWERNHGKYWINVKRSSLVREVENAISIK